ncbi:MAG: hypothetical protein U1F49_17630 [Rubrivivax sp.]
MHKGEFDGRGALLPPSRSPADGAGHCASTASTPSSDVPDIKPAKSAIAS